VTPSVIVTANGSGVASDILTLAGEQKLLRRQSAGGSFVRRVLDIDILFS
jgi:hypothetical protein